MYPGAWHLAMSQAALSRGRARRRALQGLRGREQLVEVGHLAGVVAPCAADRTPALDEEGRSFGNVLHAAEHVRDPESPHGVRVPVGDELDLAEVERLAPRGLRPGRVARDRERPHPGRIELRSPVTQELELVRSGRRPGEEEEKQKERPREVLHRDGLPRCEPDGRVGDWFADTQHVTTLVPRRGLEQGLDIETGTIGEDMRAVGIIRQSNSRGKSEGLSPAEQREKIEAYCAGRRWDL